MRLIDADRIDRNQVTVYDYKDQKWVHIFEIPTVDAIPIEWIKKWVNNYCDWNQEKLIECLLRTWSKMGERDE